MHVICGVDDMRRLTDLCMAGEFEEALEIIERNEMGEQWSNVRERNLVVEAGIFDPHSHIDTILRAHLVDNMFDGRIDIHTMCTYLRTGEANTFVASDVKIYVRNGLRHHFTEPAVRISTMKDPKIWNGMDPSLSSLQHVDHSEKWCILGYEGLSREHAMEQVPEHDLEDLFVEQLKGEE